MKHDPRNNIWKDIPGFNGIYKINYYGHIKRVCGPGMKTVTPFNNKRGQKVVKLTTAEKKRTTYTIKSLMIKTFFPKHQKGNGFYFKNGIINDICLDNLVEGTLQEIGQLHGKNARRRPVVKKDKDGNIVDCYSSASEAAKLNYVNCHAITDRCNGKCKKFKTIDGYYFEWDDINGNGKKDA
jgi:NUMOD4 motif.